MAEPTPWPRLLAHAAALGVAPAAFWRLGLREWRALVAPADAALSRDAFEHLIQRFPDEQR